MGKIRGQTGVIVVSMPLKKLHEISKTIIIQGEILNIHDLRTETAIFIIYTQKLSIIFNFKKSFLM